jgi:sugar phosphate isomerase/epimerase
MQWDTMLLAFSTNAFTRFDLNTALTGIADAGFSAVEILADAPHADPRTFTDSDIAQLRRTLESKALRVSNVNANCTFSYWKDAPQEPYFEPSLLSPSDRMRQDRIDLIKRTLHLAREIGAPNISITSGRCLAHVTPADAVARLSEGLKIILDEADKRGVDIGIELEPGVYLEFVHELRDWIARLNHPRFGANLDIGHAVVNGERIDESVQTLAGRIWNLHVEDLPARKHYHTIPGRGTFDWVQLKDALTRINYKRGVTVELYTMIQDPHAAARESYAFLAPQFG